MNKLTQEQEAVVYHPIGKHARILAVAGSGKTSTLVYRIKYLIEEKHEDPGSIQVLMFNNLAGREFKKKMDEEQIPQNSQPKVNTFHSFAFSTIQKLIASGLIPNYWEYWIEDKVELKTKNLIKAVNSLEKRGEIPRNSIDFDDAEKAIQLWKDSLISPRRAGYYGNAYLPLVYAEYEKLRLLSNGLAYEDWIPMVVSFLGKDSDLLNRFAGIYKFVIVDEYQDVNFGQQKLIEFLAGNYADLMVVGDDDQTIYEWRGARPEYIIKRFSETFDNKPFIDYTLSSTFRFGPVIAQAAFNSITINNNRVPKKLVSHYIEKPAFINISEYSGDQRFDSTKELANILLEIVQKTRDPSKIIILCRLYSQLNSLETMFIKRNIPYRIIDQKPFFQRYEIIVLLDYLRLSLKYKEKIDNSIINDFLTILNTPNRLLSKRDFEGLLSTAKNQDLSLSEVLQNFIESPINPLNKKQTERLLELMGTLEQINKKIETKEEFNTGILISEITTGVDYFAHLENFYGKGENSFERIQSINGFIEFAKNINLSPQAFIEYVLKLDTTLGEKDDRKIILMTSVFKTKGMEFEYVFIPDCIEESMPCLYPSENRIYDLSGEITEPEVSKEIENERRLFYVAITRAKKAVFIGVPNGRVPSRFIEEMELTPTFAIMKPLQEYASGNKNARETLICESKEYGGHKKIIEPLIKYYLAKIGDNSLQTRIDLITKAVTATPFKYTKVYKKTENEKKADINLILSSAWDDAE